MGARAVTFDFGQTLADMDSAMLSRRLAERGVQCTEARIEAAVGAAWDAYNKAIRAGHGGHPWHRLMDALLEAAGVHPRDELVEWLWSEQPGKNLWRRPVPGMIELVRELRAKGVPVGVVSNSEGRLAELIAEMNWSSDLPVVADSGRLGINKPSPEIFRWTTDRLGVSLEDSVHVGDAWAADFVGALDAGMRAVLFRGSAFIPAGDARLKNPRAAVCEQPDELRDILRGWGFAV